MTISEFDNIIATDRLTLVDFYAPWCGPCRAVEPTLDRVAQCMGDISTIVRIDTGDREHRALVRRYNIVSVPTFLLFMRSELLWRLSGVISFELLSNILRRHHAVGEY